MSLPLLPPALLAPRDALELSYAGHYVPTLAKAILDHNANAAPKLNLQGFAVGNPLTNEVVRACAPRSARSFLFSRLHLSLD